jgi:tetratricopeptide (TPR) repeat protein
MYNKYLIHLYTSDLKDYNKALAIALTEIERRPTPETYNWLAYVYYNKGEAEKAYQIVRDYVNKKSFDPEALMNMGFINAAIGKKDEARKLLSICLESSFELGPVETQKIKEKLKEII